MSGTASALQLPNEGDLVQTSDLSTPKANDITLPDTHANGNSMANPDSARMMANGQHDVIDISASHSQDMGEIRSPQPTSLAQIMTSTSFTLTTPPSSPGISYPPPLQLEYSSSAPMPETPKVHTVANGDPDVPSHLYKRLPQHFLHKEEGSDELVPDYMRMILLSKVYSPPLNLKETPLTLAVNLSGRLGCEVWLKREDLQPVFSFKIRGAYNLMASLTKEERWKGVVTCSAGNHAQGVALAGYHLKIPCTIVMPTGTPSIKWRNVERLGAKVVLHGQDFDEAKTECARLAKTYGLHFIPPYDDPMVVAGQGTVAVELARQIKDFESLDGIFASAGGGGLLAGISAYTKRIAPQMKVIGVETHDGDAMKRSIAAGKRVMLQEVGPFADGTAVKIVGEEPFRLCKNLLDEVVLVSNDEICAAIKDVFEETRAIPEPSGALGLAGLKAYIQERGLQNSGKRFVAVISGANMNFGRLRFVAERAELGERREVLMGVKIPEQPGSFVKLHSIIHPRATTEFVYRYSSPKEAYIITSFLLNSSPSSASGPTPEARAEELAGLQTKMAEAGMESVDLSDDEFAKSHVRHMVGGKKFVEHERIFRFEFPERPGALRKFLSGLQTDWNITMFHYRNHGAGIILRGNLKL
ncbi:hypothetical protein QFC20_004589 [Naganishia adeliensis]|uniref:Uncharacterized protein n=1 Tax=Naganishia adeliensis TaxID=92952 RepID=A0ACC2VZN5_9TREE|nr:hypothetical protein QFC20_004589 [Naganishia adeliensis]